MPEARSAQAIKEACWAMPCTAQAMITDLAHSNQQMFDADRDQTGMLSLEFR